MCNDPVTRTASFFMVVMLGVSLTAADLAAQTTADDDERRSLPALRLEPGEEISLDGLIVEPAWTRATPAGAFVQRDPIEGVAPTESTEVFVVYDSDYLYIGAILYDSDPDGILAFQKERDASLFADDRFTWILDTFLDGRTGYYFEVNPAGLMSDGLLGGGGGGFGRGGGGGGGFGFGVNKSWDGI